MADENIYQDGNHGWVAEVFTQGSWIRIGVFGTRDAAKQALVRTRLFSNPR